MSYAKLDARRPPPSRSLRRTRRILVIAVGGQRGGDVEFPPPTNGSEVDEDGLGLTLEGDDEHLAVRVVDMESESVEPGRARTCCEDAARRW
jgi:hypothetical protein